VYGRSPLCNLPAKRKIVIKGGAVLGKTVFTSASSEKWHKSTDHYRVAFYGTALRDFESGLKTILFS
jgi:hypothetical protein